MSDPTVESPAQEASPVALIRGAPLTELPQDLYIPPDALQVFLEAFEGPLDLLLYLIRRHNLDILDIPIAAITRQYMDYIALMQEMELELAADYLVMAAVLAEIKSRMLLPRTEQAAEEEEEDPRAELVRRLQEYERYKRAAEDLDQLPRLDRDLFPVRAEPPTRPGAAPPQVALTELLKALKDITRRAEMFAHHHVQMEPLSVRERMSEVLGAVGGEGFTAFAGLFAGRRKAGGVW